MANDLAGAVSGAEQIGQAGQAQPGQGENPTGNSQAASGLTLEQVQAAIDQALAAREQRTNRAIQSQLDKRDANILKRIEQANQQKTQIVKAAQARGIDPSAAQALGQSLVDDELAAILEEQKLAEQQQAQQGQQPDEGQIVTQYAQSMIMTLGLSESDPELLEAYKVMQKARTPDEYLGAITQAHRAKLRRELLAEQGGGAGQQQPQGQPANPARMVGFGSDGGQRSPANPIKDIDSPSDLYNLAFGIKK